MRQRLRTEGIVLLPALPAVALFVYWGAHEGGYLPTTWGPSALVILGLLVATVVGVGVRLTRPAAIALAALVAFTAWSYLSIAWAASPGEALEGSNRTLLFLLLFALFALLPWRAWTACTALSAFALGIGVIAVVILARLGSAEHVRQLFIEARLAEPTGYVNASPALFTMAAIVASALGGRRELPILLRATLLALATAALQAAVLSESRGWLFALPVVALAMLALMPGRLRFALWSLLPLAGGLISLPALLAVYERPDQAGSSPTAYMRALIDAADHAGAVALPICAGVFVVALALAFADRRTRVSRRVATGANRAAAGLAVLAVVLAVVAAFVVTDGRPDRELTDYWDRSGTYQETTVGSSRFSSVGSNRPDFYRVALDAFAAHPIGGLGQDNWAEFYLRQRDSGEEPRWVHSLQLRLLAHTGLVGFLLFGVFIVGALVATLRGRRRRRVDPLTAVAAATALAPLVVWVAHGSIDWFWEIPALSGPAFAFLGLATAVATPRAPESATEDSSEVDGARPERVERASNSLRHGAVAAAAIAVTLALAAVLAFPYLAERDVVDTGADWRQDPSAALRDLDRAAKLNPLSARADITAGVIALEVGTPELALQRFARAIERSPDDWFAHFGRGLAESTKGARSDARSEYEAAHRLSPDEPLVDEALRRVDGRRPVRPAEAFTILRDRVAKLTGE